MKAEDVRFTGGALPRGGYALGDIVADLWGAPQGAEEGAPGSPAAFPPFEQFWRAVDADVDWTDALVRDTPPDGLTSPALWRFYHGQAPAVLAGDVRAYLAVLKTADPLGDLKPYVRGMTVGAPDADTLRCRFQAEPAYLSGTPAEARRYLAAVALRAARDLMALLPVCRVRAEAYRGEAELLEAEYAREALQGVRFGLADPVALTQTCGGRFSGGLEAPPGPSANAAPE